MRAALFVLGLLLTVAGVALWSAPAALLLAGVELSTLMWQLEKAHATKSKPRTRQREEVDL